MTADDDLDPDTLRWAADYVERVAPSWGSVTKRLARALRGKATRVEKAQRAKAAKP